MLKVVDEVKKEISLECLLLENGDRNELLSIEQTCDLAIDQVGGEMGDSGYGKNSLENLAMGMPTFTEFADDDVNFLSEHPLVKSNRNKLKEKIITLLKDEARIESLAVQGRRWAEETHSFEAVNEKLLSYYNKI